MDDARFDRLTRRFVFAGLAGGSFATLVGPDVVEGKKKLSKRKRCRKKKRKFCAGRCCRKRHRCEGKACIQACENPFTCPDAGGGSGCGTPPNCFCSTTIGGATACVVSESSACENFEACSAVDRCPAGLICAICRCLDATPDFRCKRPCPAA